MNLTEKLNQEIDRVTSERVRKEVDRLFKAAREFVLERLPNMEEAFKDIVAHATEDLSVTIREAVETEIIERLATPTKVTPKVPFDMDKLREFEDAARKIRPQSPMPCPPWPWPPQQPYTPPAPNGPYKPPFGPVWCGGTNNHGL
jgi:hypothetical protein